MINCFFLWVMHIGKQIKIARMFRGLTQQDLAEKVHRTRPLISSIEQTGVVNVHTLKMICEVLEVDPEALKAKSYDTTMSSLVAKQGFDELKRENENLRLEIASLKDLISTQKDLIELLKMKHPKK